MHQPKLNPSQLDAFGAEMDAIRAQVRSDLGERDTRYIKRLIRFQRRLDTGSRALIFFSLLFWPGLTHALASWAAFLPLITIGTVGLGVAKILDNMEIGHNIMHGQYDWTGDPELNSQRFDWDTACPGDQWRHSHNYMHHTYTNILGKDRDVGYGVLRMAEEQPWRPYCLGNPLYAFLLMLNFDLGVALHDVEADRLFKREKRWSEAWPTLRGGLKKIGKVFLKDYVLFPALAGPLFFVVLFANLIANVIRNIWAFVIIFCGHFPDGVEIFDESICKDESRGHWYYRQLLGSANLDGGKLFHLMSGNLSHQIEHHLFPDLPAHRYAEISPQVREICIRYGLPYNSGPLHRQFGSVVRSICRLALPGRQRPFDLDHGHVR